MKNFIIIISIVVTIIVSSCNIGITRQETDVYTISERDTTTLFFVQNAPGNRDNGVIYPSSRTFKSSRYLLQQDSIVDRFYPDFIRLGAFESVGLFLGGDREHSLATGLFGIFHDFDKDYKIFQGEPDRTFVGGIYRFGIGEWRLRWFRDAKNWTIGTSIYEVIAPEARLEKILTSAFPLYLRKRYFLSEEIPYVCITPTIGLGYYPSQYVNASISLDVGSIGGLNLRAYAGLAAGSNPKDSWMVRDSRNPDESQSSVFPYAGIGISFLDFLNIVPETYTEWKDHPHSSWDIGILQFTMLKSGEKYTVFSDTTNEAFFNGFLLRLLNASVALPIDVLSYKLYAGTSLLNFVFLGREAWGIGVLPIRIGFWQTLIQDELSLEPFAEYNYYPSSIFHFGAKLNLRLTDQINIGFAAGYASGKTVEIIGNNFVDNFGNPFEFSNGYIGVNIGIMDKIFFSQDLRYNKNQWRD